MNKNSIIEKIKNNIIQFDSKNHSAWNPKKNFYERIKTLPLYFLEFNHCSRNSVNQSVTVTHYVPYRIEIIAIPKIIKCYSKNFTVCDIGCGNGFLGSLLAREGLKVFGIDNRSYKQPQIFNFFDNKCYEILEVDLEELEIPFDVAFCSWMTPGINLTPMIIKRKPSLIIHLAMLGKQPNGNPITGTPEAYKCPRNYKLISCWESTLPENFFTPLNEIMGLKLCENLIKKRFVFVYAHISQKSIARVSPLDFTGSYNWDKERNFINQIRINKGLKQCSIETLFPPPQKVP